MPTVTQTLRDYYAASNKDDLLGMVSHYHEPVTFIGATGVTSFTTRAEATPFLAQFFARLRAMGAVRTEWTESHIKELSDTLAVADIGLVRFTADGGEIERVAFASCHLRDHGRPVPRVHEQRVRDDGIACAVLRARGDRRQVLLPSWRSWLPSTSVSSIGKHTSYR